MRKLLVLFLVGSFGACLWFVTTRTAHAVDGTDTWTVGPNCRGFTDTDQHRCAFIPTRVFIGQDGTPYDQWNLIAVEPGIVTSVSCQIMASHVMEYLAVVPPNTTKRDTFPGDHYGNVGICRGWINGGNGPVQMTVTYGLAAGTTKKPAKK